MSDDEDARSSQTSGRRASTSLIRHRARERVSDTSRLSSRSRSRTNGCVRPRPSALRPWSAVAHTSQSTSTRRVRRWRSISRSSRTAVAMSASSTSDTAATAAAAAASSAAKDAAAKEASDWTSPSTSLGREPRGGSSRTPPRSRARARMESAAAKLRGDALASDLGFRPADDDLACLGAPPLSYVARRGARALAVVSGSSRRPTPSATPTDPRDTPRADSLMITNGVSHGLDLACAALTRPGDVVVVELPTYFLAADVFADPRDSPPSGSGAGRGRGRGHFDVDAFERVFAIRTTRFDRGYFTWSPPTRIRGGTLPERDRERLILLAREFGFFVVAGGVYHLLHWGDEPPPRRFAQIEREMEEKEGEDAWDAGADGWKVRAKADEDEDEENVYAEAPSEPDASNTASDAASDASFPRTPALPDVRSPLTARARVSPPGTRPLGWFLCRPSPRFWRPERASGGRRRRHRSSPPSPIEGTWRAAVVAPLAAGLVAEAIALGDRSEWLETLSDVRRVREALAEAVEEERNATGWSAVRPQPEDTSCG